MVFITGPDGKQNSGWISEGGGEPQSSKLVGEWGVQFIL